MKKLIILVFITAFYANSRAQVGINTADPKALFDVSVLNKDAPLSTDGILIPRLNRFPAQNPGADQHGMLIFLNTGTANFPVGFYFWNNTDSSWEALTGKPAAAFYVEGTTTPADDISGAIFRTGNVRIGGEENSEIKLKVAIIPAETSVKTGLEVVNSNSADTRTTYTIQATNESLTNATKYGIKNYVNSDGEGIHYGIWNNVTQKHNSEIYGIYNEVGKTFGASQKHYGIYSEIGTESGDGWVYGIYSKALGDDPDEVYAGYFAGRVGIGATPSVEYVFPDSRGMQRQVLTLAENGILEWKYPNQQIYTSTESATGNYVIPPETSTLRINDQISSITIPQASENDGRVITLVNWTGNSAKTFNFLNNDDIFDVTTNSDVNSIAGGTVLKIQSAGNRWIVLNKYTQ